MSYFFVLALHHIQVTGLDENRLTVTNSFEHLFVSLLFVDNRFFVAEIFSLFSDLLLHYIIFSKFSELLLEHQLVVLVGHERFNLLLTSFEFLHDLPITLSLNLAVIALARFTEFKGFLSFLLGFIEFPDLVFVVWSHLFSTFVRLMRSIFYSHSHFLILLRSIMRQSLFKWLVSSSQIILFHGEALSISGVAFWQLFVVKLQFVFYSLSFFRCQSSLVLLHFGKLIFLLVCKLHNTRHASFSYILQFFVSQLVFFLPPSVSLALIDSFCLLLISQNLVDFVTFLSNPLLQSFHICFQLEISCSKHFFKTSLLHLFL